MSASQLRHQVANRHRTCAANDGKARSRRSDSRNCGMRHIPIHFAICVPRLVQKSRKILHTSQVFPLCRSKLIPKALIEQFMHTRLHVLSLSAVFRLARKVAQQLRLSAHHARAIVDTRRLDLWRTKALVIIIGTEQQCIHSVPSINEEFGFSSRVGFYSFTGDYSVREIIPFAGQRAS
jgi:hypothetical protein